MHNFVKLILFLFLFGITAIGCEEFKSGKAKFEQTAFYEKGISQIYAVYTDSISWEEMETFAQKKPWKSDKITIVLFFNERVYSVDQDAVMDHNLLLQEYSPQYLGMYLHSAQDEEHFFRRENL